MRISAVLLARTIAFLDTADLNPRGSVNIPGLIPIIAKRFSFQKFPKKFGSDEENGDKKDDQKGLIFEHGYIEGLTVQNMTLYSDGIKIDLLSSTEDGKRIIRDTLRWLGDEVGLNFSENMLKRWGFISNLTFESDVDLDAIHPALRLLAENVDKLVSSRLGTDIGYRPTGVTLDFERANREISLAQFTIERRAKAPFSENKYFSSAPLETDDHIFVLQQFENDIRLSR